MIELSVKRLFANTKDSRYLLPGLLSVFYLLIKAVNNLLYLSVLTIFLEKAGAESLPWVYLAVNAGFIFIQFQFITRIAGFEGHWLLSKLSVPVIFLSFIAALILPSESTLLLIAFLVSAMLTDLVINQAFTAMLNHFLSLSESRRVLPYVYASGSLGYILSGLMLKFVLDLAGFNGLLALNGCLAIIAALVVSKLKSFEEHRLKVEQLDKESDKPEKDKKEKEQIESSLKHPLAKLLIYSSFLIIFNRYLIDFLFAAAVSTYFNSSKALASFIGVLGASADLIVIGLQAFVMKKVFSNFPVGRVLTLVPTMLAFLCFSAAFSKEFAVIAAVQFLVMINSKNFTVPATTLLMGAIPQKERVFYRRDMSISCSIASTLVGIFLLLVRGVLSPSVLFLIASALYLLMAGFHFLLDKAYLITLRRQIISSEDVADEQQVSSIRYLKKADKIEQLKALLQNKNPETRKLAINETQNLSPAISKDILSGFLKTEQNDECFGAAARALLKVCGHGAVNEVKAIIESSDDFRLQADLIEALGKIGEGEELAMEKLDHSHHRIKASALINLLRTTRNAQCIEKALKTLATMARDKVELMRASAAAVMGELGLPLFLPCLETLASEPCQSVSLRALNSIARIQSPMASECLIRLKEHSDKKVAAEAVRLANLAAKTEMKTIGRLMASISTDERLMLSKRIRQMRSGTGQQTLALILCIENKVIRKRLIEFLEKADANSADLLSRCLLTGRNEAVELTLAPVFSGILDEFFTELFDGIEIINIIGNGTLEEKDESPQLISGMNFLSAILAEVAVIAEKELPVDLESKFNKRVEVACSAFLCLSHDPMPLLTSLEQLNSSRRHVASMAQEFIESHIGKNHAQLVVEIMKKSKTKDADASQLIDYGQSMGLNVSDATLELARTRLDYYLFSERNHS